ncbi:MAG TPA: cupin domain-containing protein [Candidatus Wallbacteria bacterium]|nr:MAG: Cupin domain protein [bacterium ADurb.Bin243]HOD41688.1 cupin domain-containing protein [Candidatus Wallbacteria bacterium]HPG57130.1 cupin domain-containing protein [Candidatus Wallbacteria bacterium]
MIKFYDDVECRVNKNVRGGEGEVVARYYLNENSSRLRFNSLNLNEMESGATIAEHKHTGEDEFYFITEGRGTAILNGESFEVGPGDGYMCHSGSTHGILNNITGQKLKFISIFFKQ